MTALRGYQERTFSVLTVSPKKRHGMPPRAIQGLSHTGVMEQNKRTVFMTIVLGSKEVVTSSFGTLRTGEQGAVVGRVILH